MAMDTKTVISNLCLFLVLVGALNWGLVGAFGFDLVAWIGKNTARPVATLVYLLVGLAAIVFILLKLAMKQEKFTDAKKHEKFMDAKKKP